MNDDRLIRQALLDAALADYGTADLPEASSFSTKYLTWERKFLRNPQAFAQRALRPLWKTALRSAACFLLVVVLSVGTFMTFIPEATAWLTNLYRRDFSEYGTYYYEGNESLMTEDLRDWTLGYLPEGYVQTDYIDLENMIIQLYNTDDPTMEIEFDYQLLQGHGIWGLDNEYHIISPVRVNGMQGDFWQGIDGRPNFLVWFDEANKYTFLLMSRQPCDVLIQIAESVELVK